MTHGQLVTEADLKGLRDPSHWLGRWRVGFGKDVLEGVVGVYTHFVVDTLADDGGPRTLRTALQSNTPYFITFDPVLGEGTITINSDLFFRLNKFVDGRGVRITLAGSGSLLPSTAGGIDQYGTLNIRYQSGLTGGGEGADTYEFWGSTGAGRLSIWFINNWFNRPEEWTSGDGHLDIDNGPDDGFYVTLACNRFGHDSIKIGHCCLLTGNDVDTHNNEHDRATMVRNGFWGFNGVRSRMPLATDNHLESMENLRQIGFEGLVIRNNSVANLQRAMARSRYDVFDGAFIESPTNNHPIESGNSAWVRIENLLTYNDANFDVFEEFNRDAVTDAAMYQEEDGTSLAQYNDYTPGVDFQGLTAVQAADLIKAFAGTFDEVKLGGSAGFIINVDDIDGKTLTFTSTFDAWPAWDNTQKQKFIDVGIEGSGPNTVALRNALSPADISVAGNLVTVTVPPGTGATMTDPGDETVRFIIPGDLTAAGTRTGTEDTLLLQSSGGGELPPDNPPELDFFRSFTWPYRKYLRGA